MAFSLRNISKGSTLLALITVLLLGCGKSDTAPSVTESTPSAQATSSGSSEPSPSSAETTRTLNDAAGHEVKIPVNPQRIIAPFLEDALTALGVKPVAQWGIGSVPQVYLQKQLSDVPVMNMNTGLSPELALKYQPDLIVFTAPSWIKNGDYDTYAQIAPTFVLSNDDQSWRENLTKLGEVLGKSEEAQAALSAYDEKLKQARATIEQSVGTKTAAILLGNDEKSFQLFGNSFYSAGVLFDGLGFKPTAAVTGDFETYTLEKLPDLQDVDYLFVLTGKGRARPPENNSLWKALPAVKQGHVFEVDAGHWFNSNAVANGLIIDDVLSKVVK